MYPIDVCEGIIREEEESVEEVDVESWLAGCF